ncbi:MAG: NAD(P)/FAD-dependent oxidoreductase [Actinomycetales bacterium]|nr:NAD(P)/FAD-dependent oxidoreductase [Actinomycetales bacterium]
MPDRTDCVIIGAGHNGLVAACYLAMAGKRVHILEAQQAVGGATVSSRVFPGVDAALSKYSYLVSLFAHQIRQELGVSIRTQKRRVASYTPDPPNPAQGMLVPAGDGDGLERSIERLTGRRDDAAAWREFTARTATLARIIFPTMLEPLRSREQMRQLVPDDLWRDFIERPIGEVIERTFTDDLVRGVVLTDALIGTFSHAHDPSLRQNQCFLYHVIGNGTGDWDVPVGGMGALTGALLARASELQVQVTTGARVTAVEANGVRAMVRAETATGTLRIDCQDVLANCAPAVLDELLGRAPRPIKAADAGAQVKVNMVLKRLPRLRDQTVDPADAFAGTFHVNESYRQLAAAHGIASRGEIPTPLPLEIYCHSLTDPTILGPELRQSGAQTMTVFALQTPHALFAGGDDRMRKRALRAVVASLNSVLAEPIQGCLLIDAEGRPCIETNTTADIEQALGIPTGNIFHTPLDWPFVDDPALVGTWGGETEIPNVTICGSGARRGGGVSGIPGRNAAHYLLSRP